MSLKDLGVRAYCCIVFGSEEIFVQNFLSLLKNMMELET